MVYGLATEGSEFISLQGFSLLNQKANIAFFQLIGLGASRNVRNRCIDMSPPHVNFLKASHWPSNHTIS